MIHPFHHAFSTSYPGPGHSRIRLSKENQISFTSAKPSSSSSVFWICPGDSYQLDVPRTPPEGGAQESALPGAQTTTAKFSSKFPPGSPSSSPYLYGWAQTPSGGNILATCIHNLILPQSLPKLVMHRSGLERRKWGSNSLPTWTRL